MRKGQNRYESLVGSNTEHEGKQEFCCCCCCLYLFTGNFVNCGTTPGDMGRKMTQTGALTVFCVPAKISTKVDAILICVLFLLT